MNLRILAAAGAAVLISAGVAMAQGTTASSTATPPAVTHAATTPSSTAHSTTTHTASSTHTAASGGAVSCRTSHAVGSACGCRKAPGRHGTVQAGANGGHNMCAVPAAAAASHG